MGSFRPKRETSTDRSAGDRQRHGKKVRSSILDNIADIIAEESIIGRSGDQIVKVPIRGVREYRFVYGDNTPGVGEGAGDEVARGDKIGEGQQGKKGQPGEAGEQPGVFLQRKRFLELNPGEKRPTRPVCLVTLRVTGQDGGASSGLPFPAPPKRLLTLLQTRY